MSLLGEVSDRDWRFLRRSVPVATFIAALCCFSPVVIVLLGIGSVSYAASLTDVLYGQYGWAFQLAGLTFLVGAAVIHLYTREDICSVETAIRKRRKILNLLGLAIILGVVGYLVWMLVVELVGLALGIM